MRVGNANLKLGDLVSFRYRDVDLRTGMPRRIGIPEIRNSLVLADYDQHLHCIKLGLLTPIEQKFLANVFAVMYQVAQRGVGSLDAVYLDRRGQEVSDNPIKAAMQKLQFEIQDLKETQEELIRKKNAVVMKPERNLTGMPSKDDPSPAGIGVKTFGKTNMRVSRQPDAVVQRAERDMQLVQKQFEAKTKELQDLTDTFIKNVQYYENMLRNIRPNDAYAFYHGFFKPYIGNNKRMKNIYRKYRLNKIQSPRLLPSAIVNVPVPGGRI